MARSVSGQGLAGWEMRFALGGRVRIVSARNAKAGNAAPFVCLAMRNVCLQSKTASEAHQDHFCPTKRCWIWPWSRRYPTRRCWIKSWSRRYPTKRCWSGPWSRWSPTKRCLIESWSRRSPTRRCWIESWSRWYPTKRRWIGPRSRWRRARSRWIEALRRRRRRWSSLSGRELLAKPSRGRGNKARWPRRHEIIHESRSRRAGFPARRPSGKALVPFGPAHRP